MTLPPVRADRNGGGLLVGAPRAASLCVVSGKGGTGKSIASASLAPLLASRGRTLLLDADFGVGNAHLLQGVSPARTLVDVVDGRLPARDALTPCHGSVQLLAGGSGVSRMTSLSSFELQRLARELCALETEYRHLVVDSAAGVSRQTAVLAAASDVVLLVTTPDATAVTDAYAFLKVLEHLRRGARVVLLVNRARDFEEGEAVAARLRVACERFLGRGLPWIGWLPDDRAVLRCVDRGVPVVTGEPAAPVSHGLRLLAVRLLEELARAERRGLGARLTGWWGPSAASGAAGPRSRGHRAEGRWTPGR